MIVVGVFIPTFAVMHANDLDDMKSDKARDEKMDAKTDTGISWNKEVVAGESGSKGNDSMGAMEMGVDEVKRPRERSSSKKKMVKFG